MPITAVPIARNRPRWSASIAQSARGPAGRPPGHRRLAAFDDARVFLAGLPPAR
jgi:hypothetical protein